MVLNILLFSFFFFQKKKSIFWKNGKKPFLGPKSLLKGIGCPATKMNITFFYGKWGFEYDCFESRECLEKKNQYNLFRRHWGFQYFSFNNLFEQNKIFQDNREKLFFLGYEKRDHPHLPHSPPSEVKGARIVVISFRNIAKKPTGSDP